MFVLFDALSDISPLQWCAVLSATIAAATFDVRCYRIPNPITFLLAAFGLLYQWTVYGSAGVGEGILTAILIAAPYLVLFLTAGGGGGDVKLMAAIGIWFGLPAGLIVLLLTAISGIILGVAVLLVQRRAALASDDPSARPASTPLPYGVAICSGVAATAFLAVIA